MVTIKSVNELFARVAMCQLRDTPAISAIYLEHSAADLRPGRKATPERIWYGVGSLEFNSETGLWEGELPAVICKLVKGDPRPLLEAATTDLLFEEVPDVSFLVTVSPAQSVSVTTMVHRLRFAGRTTAEFHAQDNGVFVHRSPHRLKTLSLHLERE
jgi:hypothetical protein